MKSLFAADIRDNQSVDALFLVAAKTHGVTKTGNSYLTLKLLDRSGEIEARVWERAEDLAAASTKMILCACAARRRFIKAKCRSACKMSCASTSRKSRRRFFAQERFDPAVHARGTANDSPRHEKSPSARAGRSLFRRRGTDALVAPRARGQDDSSSLFKRLVGAYAVAC